MMSTHTPMRRDVATRARAPKGTLLRLVLGPEGVPFVDLLGRAPGRGVYVSPGRAELIEALSPKGLARAFKGRAKTLEDAAIEALVQDTRERLEARILDLVGLSRRAGKLEIGMDAARRALSEDGVEGLIVLAKDLSERSERSFFEGSDERIRVVRISDKASLGARLGRDEVGIVAIRPSVFVGRIGAEADRLLALSQSTNAVGRGRVPAQPERTREND